MASESSKSPLFREIRISGFRGFNREVTFDLDASAILIWGSNGKGKTSLADAIQWLLLGKLPRLAPQRQHKNEDYVVNAYAKQDGRQAVVSATLTTAAESTIVATRTGSHTGSTLEVYTGNRTFVGTEADSTLRTAVCGSTLIESEFERYILSMGLLQQDVVRAFLTDETGDGRYTLLSHLLGLGVLEEFEKSLEASHTALTRRLEVAMGALRTSMKALDDASTEQREIETRLSLSGAGRSLRDELRVLASNNGPLSPWAETRLVGQAAMTDVTVDGILGELRGIDTNLHRLAQWHSSFDELAKRRASRARSEVDAEIAFLSLAALDIRQRHSVLNAELDEATTRHRAAQERAELVSKLFAAAIPLLTDICPVCGQDIHIEVVTTRLNSVLSDFGELNDSQGERDRLTAEVTRVKQEVQDVEREQLRLATEAAEAGRWQTAVDEHRAVFDAILDTLVAVRSDIPRLGSNSGGGDEARYDAEGLLAWTNHTTVAVRDAISSFDRIAAASTIDRTFNAKAAIDRRVVAAQQKVNDDKLATENLQERVNNRKLLLAHCREASAEVQMEMFGQLKPVIEDLFTRLSPHPTFRHLSLIHEVYRNKGRTVPVAFDVNENIETNPATMFSSAQANVAALCFFIAFAFSGTVIKFPFMLLDDPLQSMDDVNALGFSDLCRFLRREKQLIVTTHDDRLASLLRRKLAPREGNMSTKIIHFQSWNREGPKFTVATDTAEPTLPIFLH